MKKLPALFTLLSAMVGSVIIAGCASHPDKMAATYVSPVQFSDLNCKQIAHEIRRVSARTSTLYGTLESEADADTAQMAAGLLLLWPTLFWLEGGDDEQAAEYSRLMGEHQALEQAASSKECDTAGLVSRQPPTSAPQ